MGSETENQYFLKAVEAFKRRFVVISPEHIILAVNDPGEGLDHSSVIGKICHQVFYNRPEPCLPCPIQKSKETGRPALQPKTGDYTDPAEIPCLYVYPIFNQNSQDNSIEAFVSLDFDLSTRGEFEDKAQSSNAFLRNLILSAVDGVIAADKKGRILIFNDMAAELFGYSVEEAMESLDIRDIYPDHKELEVMKALRSDDYGGRGKLRSYEVEVLHKNGEHIPINLNASIVYEGDREVATIGFFHDQRGINRMKAELEKTQMQLLQSEKMASLGKLAAGVAHQLNNPLSGITLFTKLVLEEYNLEEGAQKDLFRVMEDAERCRDTVKELLEFARQTKHIRRPHDINRAISRTLFLLENQSLFQNIIIEKELDPTLPPVHSDIQQLNHMFMNIILNAAQAMEGKGRLQIKTLFLPEKEQVRIEISDTGPGIPDEILSHIFDPFFTTKQEGEGTGLGLSLVYGIVQNQGGEIKARNLPGEGATFIIDLPIMPKDDGGSRSE
ncbi:MAG: PAS domain S-box protein [Deltaproteobacteria bacterium]|nr:PAS domain S-box protein [Deltaproteobacteria bacterium]